MVPESYGSYFAAGASAGAALIGLLFVAISLRPDTIVGDRAGAGGRALAGSTFTSLVNAFFISLFDLLPGVNLGYVAAILGGISIFQTFRLHRHLPRAEARPVLWALSMLSFGGEVLVGGFLIASPHSRAGLDGLCYLVVAAFATALTRAWALLQGTHLRTPLPTTVDPNRPSAQAGPRP
ncbi:MAG: hypothetical protein ACRENY_01665 [Candidatus Dormibacteria bacterium]